jgi:SET and MYND domain-containing protein
MSFPLLNDCVSTHNSVYERTLTWFEWAYPRHHPLIGLQYYTHGRLAWLNKHTSIAVASFEKARINLPISHGAQHRLVHDLNATWNEAREELHHLNGGSR